MKKYMVFVFFMLLLTLFSVGILVSGFSGHFYYTIFKNGVSSEYIQIGPAKNNVLKGGVTKIKKKNLTGKRIWSKSHMNNFLLPIPFSHPLIYVTPYAKYKYNRSDIGFRFYSSSGAEVFRFFEKDNFLFKTEIDQNKLFSIPIIRNIIYEKSQGQIFKDLFSKNLFFDHNIIPEFSKELLFEILKTDWKELVYNLFIFKLRQRYLTYDRIEKITWYDNYHLGSILFIADQTGEREEILFKLVEGVIYPIYFAANNWNAQSKKIREIFITNLDHKHTSKDSSVSIYGDYRVLSYRDQIGHDGMVLLMSAWSHHQDDKKFLKEMIQRLERGEDNQEQLRALYKYALERYKQTFSSKDKVLKSDSVKSKIESGIERELLEKRKQEDEEIKNYQELEEMDFNSADDKINYFLDEALKKE